MSELENLESRTVKMVSELPAEITFAIENIPDEDRLFYRVHKNFIKNGGMIPGAIKMRGTGDEKGMSTDWSKYSDASKAKSAAPTPADNAVVSFIVGFIRSTGVASVKHNPIIGNRAHSHVLWNDVDEIKVRQQLSKIDSYTWEITHS